MIHSDGLEEAKEFGVTAMERMARLAIPPIPRNYEIWYTYETGRDNELNEEIDSYLRANKGFPEAVIEGWYRKLSGPALDDTTILRTAGEMETIVSDLLKLTRAAATGNKGYGEVLHQASGQISQMKSQEEELKAILKTLVAETRKMETRYTRLEKELLSSSGEVHRLHEDLKRLRAEALTDGLTGLANRRWFDSALREISAQSDARRIPMALILLDIDHFKRVNDTYGHPIGDKVLRFIAQTMGDVVRKDDVVARYGGEEFAIILPAVNLDLAVDVAESLRELIASRRLTQRNSKQVIGPVTISAGVAEYRRDEPLASLIDRADKCLYKAKRDGRNRVVTETALTESE